MAENVYRAFARKCVRTLCKRLLISDKLLRKNEGEPAPTLTNQMRPTPSQGTAVPRAGDFILNTFKNDRSVVLTCHDVPAAIPA
jgi:hypothetical protein